MIKVDEKQERTQKNLQAHAKNPYPSMIKVDEKQERRMHAKNPYPSMIKVD